jgi:hypothetical protein
MQGREKGLRQEIDRLVGSEVIQSSAWSVMQERDKRLRQETVGLVR